MNEAALLDRIFCFLTWAPAALAFRFVLATPQAYAATIVVRNTAEDGIGAYAVATSSFQRFDNTDVMTANDGYGLLGKMNVSDAVIANLYLAGDVAAIRSAFQPFSTPFSLETTGLAGAFLDERSGDTRASSNNFGGSALYLWIYKGSTLLAATEHLLARLDAAFPTDPQSGSPLNRTVSLSPGGVANLGI